MITHDNSGGSAGILQFIPEVKRKEIEARINFYYENVYECMSDLRTSLQDFDDFMSGIFYGVRIEHQKREIPIRRFLEEDCE